MAERFARGAPTVTARIKSVSPRAWPSAHTLLCLETKGHVETWNNPSSWTHVCVMHRTLAALAAMSLSASGTAHGEPKPSAKRKSHEPAKHQVEAVIALASGDPKKIKRHLARRITFAFECSVCDGEDAAATPTELTRHAAAAELSDRVEDGGNFTYRFDGEMKCTPTRCTLDHGKLQLNHSSGYVFSVDFCAKTRLVTGLSGIHG